jgi:hypothetical protein
MNVVIKFLVFSFPVVFAVTLFWPFIGADKRGTDEEASLAYPPAVEDPPPDGGRTKLTC